MAPRFTSLLRAKQALATLADGPVRRLRKAARLPERLREHETALAAHERSISDVYDRLSRTESFLLRLDQRTKRSDAGPRPVAAPAIDASREREYVATPAGQDPVLLDINVNRYGGKTYSQNDEDGILAYLFDCLGGAPGYFVEFGVGPHDGTQIEDGGLECNCRLLQEQGWRGLYMDGRNYPSEFMVKQEIITALNIEPLLRKYNVPLQFDLLSIDIDGQDFWTWMAIQRFPRVVVIEYNPAFEVDESFVIPMDTNYRWDGTQWYGASLRAMHKLGIAKGYTLVYANGVNAFFVRRDLLSNADSFEFETIHAYRGKLLYHRPDPLQRAYQHV